MLIRLSNNTWAESDCLKLALITNAQDPASRRLWVRSTAAPEDPIQIDWPYQKAVIEALKLTELEGADV